MGITLRAPGKALKDTWVAVSSMTPPPGGLKARCRSKSLPLDWRLQRSKMDRVIFHHQIWSGLAARKDGQFKK